MPWEWEGRTINLVDTAGIRKKARVERQARKARGRRCAAFDPVREVVVLLLDATIPFEKQDLMLADLVYREGRAMVIALNKWDLIEDKQATLVKLREDCEELLPQLRGVPLVTISGLQGRNIDRLMQAIFKIEKAWNTHLSTAKLNRWLGATVERHSAPGRQRATPQATLHDAGQDAAAELHYLFVAHRGQRADVVPALSHQFDARDVRYAGHADPAVAQIRQEPLRQVGVAVSIAP